MLQKEIRLALFTFIFSFSRGRVFISLYTHKKKNLIYMSSGFVIKFFDNRKAIKKTKIVKLMLARYVRKLCLLSNLTQIYLIVKGIPMFLPEMLGALNQRASHKFLDPHTNVLFDETDKRVLPQIIKIPYFFFLRNEAFSPVKLSRKGRIKRKLQRKIIA